MPSCASSRLSVNIAVSRSRCSRARKYISVENAISAFRIARSIRMHADERGKVGQGERGREKKNPRSQHRSGGDSPVSRVTDTRAYAVFIRESRKQRASEHGANASRNGRRVATPEIACINIGARHFHSVNFPRWTHPRETAMKFYTLRTSPSTSLHQLFRNVMRHA